MQQFYPLKFFINKFKEIPDEYFSSYTDANPMDAWEWLDEKEAIALYEYTKPYGLLVHVNDGIDEYSNLGTTFKERIINFLQLVMTLRSSCVE